MPDMIAPPLAGVVGWPIGHSRSPRLHGHWLKRYRLAGHYVPIPVAPEDLAWALAALPRLGFRGVNVTIPHKEAALALAAEATERARRIGAANTLTFLPGGAFRADNTDGFGFLASLRQSAPEWSAARGPALILGAGGASRAVIDALLADNAPEIRLANRTRLRAAALAAQAGNRVRTVDWTEAGEAMADAMTIVNATALGMEGQPALDLAFDTAPRQALATDLVYQPLRTAFLERAAAAGLRTVDGLGMLLHQAAPGFEAWFGLTPQVDEELRQAVLAAPDAVA
jgi:shikimate dehydrogenase